jgi:hypothetical protein
MFKKTLLAVSILGGASFAANAGTLTASIEETAAIETAQTGNECTVIATNLGVTADLATFKNDDGGAVPDTVTFADNGTAAVGDFGTNTVVFTADDECTVTLAKDTLINASSVANSLEGAQADGLTITAVAIAGVGGYTNEDTVRLTVTGGVVDELASAGATMVGQNGSSFTLIGVLGNEILFTVDTGSQVGFEIVDLDLIKVTPNAGVTEISIEAETQNTANVIYDRSPSAKVSELKAQYSSALVAGYDGVIDVSKERLSLALNANDAYNTSGQKLTVPVDEVMDQDTAVLKVAVETSQGNLVAASADLVIKGDFAWMADLDVSPSADDLPTSTELLAGLTYAVFTDAALQTAGNDAPSLAAVSADYQELTITLNPNGDDLDAYHLVGFKVPGEATGTTSLNVTDFEAGLVVKDAADNTATVLASDTKIGEWTLNGSVVTIPYMPFGPNTKVILRHTSTSNQVGDITVRYILEDLDPSNGDNWVSVGTVVTDVANGVLDIRDAVMDAIEADTGLDKGKVAIEITTNVPAEDVTVYAAYNVKNSADDRGFVGTFGKLGSAGVPVTP